MCHPLSIALAAIVWLLVAPPAAAASAHELCGECHLGGAAAVANAPERSVTDRCVACHPTKRSFGQSVHACTACHDPHPNGTKAWLREPVRSTKGVAYDRTTRLCLDCHEAASHTVGQNGHYIQHPVGIALAAPRRDASLPLYDVRGTAHPGDDVIGCLTCHVAHQAADGKLRRWADANEPAACRSCHELDRPRDAMTAFRLAPAALVSTKGYPSERRSRARPRGDSE